MGLFDWLGQRIGGEARQRARVVIPDARNQTGRDRGVRAEAEQHYVRLWISELFLKYDNEWFTSRYPLAYSVIGLDYGGQKTEIANISGKNRFDIKQPDLGKSILRDYPLTPLLPFRGGTIELDCGLVSMKADNVLQNFAGVVSDIASKLNQPFAASMVGIAGSIATGVQSLLGAGETKTVLYLHETFDRSTLQAGYTYLSGKPQADVKPGEIWVTTEGIRTGPNKDLLREMDAQDYFVMRVEVTDSRDDWRAMKVIEEPLNAAIEASLSSETDKAKLLLTQAKRAALNSTDLTRLDKVRVVKGIDTEFNAPAGPQAAGDGLGELPSSLERAAARITSEAARGDPAFRDESLLEMLTWRS
jgi:hypothetical protein